MTISDLSPAVDWQSVRQGESKAFEAVVERFKDSVSAVAYARTGDFTGSEDIAQETFLVAWQARDQLKEPARLAAWLCGIARNLSFQWLRKRGNLKTVESVFENTDVADDQPHPVDRMITLEERQIVWSTLESLDEIYRETLVLFYRQSHSVAEVARTLDVSEDVVRQRLSRGRQLIKNEISRTVELALEQTKPSSHFTANVMSLIGGDGISTVIGSAGAAGVAAKVATSTVMVGTKTLMSAGALGFLGGLLGSAGGLLGAWLGSWLPSQLAPTMTERKLLEKQGKQAFFAAMLFTLAQVVAVCFYVWGREFALVVGVTFNLLSFVVFFAWILINARRYNKQIMETRQTITPERDPNPTWLKEYIRPKNRSYTKQWVGRRGTSTIQFLGWPLWDFQVSDPMVYPYEETRMIRSAKGWLAIGDQATGFIALGGRALGVIALGGIARGVIAIGGVTLGIISFGGLALGGLAIGGLAIAFTAIGGGALGWHAVGGGAAGWESARGGAAISWNVSEGGLAIARDYAVGGKAIATEANTEEAQQRANELWLSDTIGMQAIRKDPQAYSRNVTWMTLLVCIPAACFTVLMPFVMYKRIPSEQALSDN